MADLLLNALTYALPFLVILTLVVTVHELGHFLMARSLGVLVERFSIGFGRGVASWTDRSGVEWRIGWIPLGGYVKFVGDADVASAQPPQFARVAQAAPANRAHFHHSAVWKRALVVAAGPAANFLLSIALFAGMLMAFGSVQITPRVSEVEPASPAARAGFLRGDVVVSMDGRPVEDFAELAQFVQQRANQPLRFTVRRLVPGMPRLVTLAATPARRIVDDPVVGRVEMGVLGLHGPKSLADLTRRRYGPAEAIAAGVARTADVVDTTVVYLGRLARGMESGDQLGGPLRIARLSGALTKAEVNAPLALGPKLESAAGALLTLAAVLSVAIGFMNLLPVPILDGGHLVFYAYEAIARRPLGPRAQAVGYRMGLGLLMGLMIFATWNDLQQLHLFKFLSGLVR